MDIERHLHLADEIDSRPADVESLESYENRVGYFESNNYTYIPMPKDERYYNTEEGWEKELRSEQIIEPDTHLMEVLRRLQRLPFLLVDYVDGDEFYIHEDNELGPRVFRSDLVEREAERDDGSMTMSVNGRRVMGKDDFQELYENSDPYSVFELRDRYPELADQELNFGYEEQYGIITIADLNKRGVRLMLYKVISELSSTLGKKIEENYPDSDEILHHLRPVTIGRWEKDQIKGLEIHVSEHMNLIEMMQVIQSSTKKFVEECGFESKQEVEKLNGINGVRNSVMHPNRSLVYDRKEIEDLLNEIGKTQNIISSIEE